jgi:hypothetical protein
MISDSEDFKKLTEDYKKQEEEKDKLKKDLIESYKKSE